ncbi:hypothetical protein D6C90_06746 [Aureobasidium pullulans]|uniref:Uncharacterized protein n=1 Tax=Aureobasidium pullulans TaxID=5580 RepID=A0A4S9UFX0_AURPU|nr:hypothetical protein D6C90_06746 [Aureobasidium pullulans]
MFGFSDLVVLAMSVVTFFTTNFPTRFTLPSWTGRLLAAPSQADWHKPSHVVDMPAVVETVTIVLTHIATATMVPPGTELAIITTTRPSSVAPSLHTLAKEMFHALYIFFHLSGDASTLVSAFFLGVILLIAFFGFLTTSPTGMKQEDLARLEAHIYNQDALIEQMRTSHKTAIEEMRASHNIAIANLNRRLILQINHTYSVSSEKNRVIDRKRDEINDLRRDNEHAWNMELMAKYKSTDKVLKLEQEISRLRTHIHGLDDKFEAAEDTIAAAEEANEKVTDANERALVATQKTQEANQKVTAAEKACEIKVEAAMKANKEKIARERQNAQAHIDKLRTEIETQKNNVRIEEYKVQELKRENKELGAKAREAAAVPNLPSFVGKTTATAAEETRRRLQALPGPESPRSPAPIPAIVAPSPTTAIGPRATPITTPAVRQTKGPRPPPTIWKAAALPNPVQLVRRKEREPFGGRAAPVGGT